MGLDKYTNTQGQQPASTPVDPPQQTSTPQTSGGSKKLVLIILLAVVFLCLIVGGVLGFLYINGQNGSNEKTDNPNSMTVNQEENEQEKEKENETEDNGECDDEYLNGFDIENITQEELEEIQERCKEEIEKEGGEYLNADQLDKQRREAVLADLDNVAKLGETITVGNLDFTVLEVQNLGSTLEVVDSKEIEKDCSVKNYETYINVKVKVKNNFSEDVTLVTQLLIDEDRTQYYSTARPFCIYETGGGNTIKSGETGEIMLLFDVKKGMNPALLEFFDETVFAGGLTEETLKLTYEDFSWGYINIGDEIE